MSEDGASRELDMVAATYSHVDGRDLLRELRPNSAHHIDIRVRRDGHHYWYEGDWLKNLMWARDGHCRGERDAGDGALSALDRQEGGDHYRTMAIQPVEYIHRNGIGFAEGCIIKYVSRWRSKGGVADLKKARHFLDMLIEMETR